MHRRRPAEIEAEGRCAVAVASPFAWFGVPQRLLKLETEEIGLFPLKVAIRRPET